MVVLIAIGVVVVAAGIWAFSPRRRGIADGDVRRRLRRDQGRAEVHRGRTDIPHGPF